MNFTSICTRWPGQLLLVTLPAPVVGLVLLRGRQSVHLQPLEDPPDAGIGDGDLVVPLQIHRDLAGSEVVVLPQVDDLPDHLGVGGIRAGPGSPGAALEPVDTLGVEASLPGVEQRTADAVVAAGRGDVPGDLLGMAEDRQPVPLLAVHVNLRYPGDVGWPVPARHDRYTAVLCRGRPFGLAKAPSSLERS